MVTCPVVIKIDQSEAHGDVTVQQFNSSQRWGRALKSLGLFWLAAAAAILIPVAHFVLVPGFFIAGLVGFSKGMSTEEIVLGGTCACPKCNSQITISRSAAKWPLSEPCMKCRMNVSITRSLARN